MQKTWQAWTFVDFGQKMSGQDGRPAGGGEATDCAGVGFGAIRAGGFLPMKAAGGVKPWQARTFAVAELAPSMTLKSYWVQKAQDPKGDAYCGS